MKRALIAVTAALTIVLGTAGAAQARPVLDDPDAGYCGPGQDSTQAYSVYTGRIGGPCTRTVVVPHRILVRAPSVWWNPWTWF